MSGTLKVSNSHIERGIAATPSLKRYETRLRALDKNKDGEIDMGELCQVLDEMSSIEKQRRLLKWAAIISGLFSLLTIAAVVGLTYAVVNMQKDTKVDSSGVLTVKDDASSAIATGQAVVFNDAKHLYNSSLADLSSLEFLIIPNEMGGGKIIHVAEVDLIPNTTAKITTITGAVYEIDASGIHQMNKTTGGRRLLASSPDMPPVSGSKDVKSRFFGYIFTRPVVQWIDANIFSWALG